ncbi:hypothetical protein N7495_006708 [Penicillium taxi]|uniref:uncharacterized protein n=1 Tax=Penicillium taxi TaxID=168475 RepID=UPI0025456F14|nr:uncharacterized protein N7495_006708 [Penicillium taxi]KAJ5895017.1 hypothetical protein N7495_006708 [Penicillium taxi]
MSKEGIGSLAILVSSIFFSFCYAIPHVPRDQPLHLAKREDSDWDKALNAGKKIAADFTGTPTQSKWTNVNSLETNGWTDQVDDPETFKSLSAVFTSIGLDRADNTIITLIQDQDVTVDGTEYLASNGFYKNTYNVKAGVIIANDNKSPREKRFEDGNDCDDVVPLAKFSDVVFLEWQKLAGTSVDGLKYMIRSEIDNAATKAVIRKACGLAANEEDWSKIEDAQEFLPGTDNFNALLGSPNGRGLGYMLSQHQSKLGKGKTVTKITVQGQKVVRTWNVMMIQEIGTA